MKSFLAPGNSLGKSRPPRILISIKILFQNSHDGPFLFLTRNPILVEAIVLLSLSKILQMEFQAGPQNYGIIGAHHFRSVVRWHEVFLRHNVNLLTFQFFVMKLE